MHILTRVWGRVGHCSQCSQLTGQKAGPGSSWPAGWPVWRSLYAKYSVANAIGGIDRAAVPLNNIFVSRFSHYQYKLVVKVETK